MKNWNFKLIEKLANNKALELENVINKSCSNLAARALNVSAADSDNVLKQ